MNETFFVCLEFLGKHTTSSMKVTKNLGTLVYKQFITPIKVELCSWHNHREMR